MQIQNKVFWTNNCYYVRKNTKIKFELSKKTKSIILKQV